MAQEDQTRTIEFLSSPSAYGLGPGTRIERCETHGAIVFLAGDRAYKLKRAVHFPYMDYSTCARRHAMCEAELRVNHSLAPEIYIEVRPVIRSAASTLRIGSAEETEGAQDWLVVMHRFEQDALLDALCERGAITKDLVALLAQRIASFHQGAEIHADHGGAHGMSMVIDECVGVFTQMRDSPFTKQRIDAFANLSGTALARCRDLLERRREGGWVRRCHGDLHMGNICVFGTKPVPFDAIEFDEEFSCIDVLYDLAFLLMDFEQHDLVEEANLLLNAYLAITGDYEGLAALPLFLACRAAIRAHVTIAMATARNGRASAAQVNHASELLDRAIRYLEAATPKLVAIGGLSGTGKSTLAAALAPWIGRPPGAILVRTDILRKNLWHATETERLPDAAYSPESSRKVYRAVGERCALILRTGHSAIADAVFGQARERTDIKQVAHAAEAKFCALWLQAPQNVLEQRIKGRTHDVSDATVTVLHRQITTIQAPRDWNIISVEGSPAEVVLQASRKLD